MKSHPHFIEKVFGAERSKGSKTWGEKIPKNPGISVLKIPGFWLTANPGIPGFLGSR